jgi:hypothetical protein
MVGLQTLNLAIGVRVPASQPFQISPFCGQGQLGEITRQPASYWFQFSEKVQLV